MKFFNEEQAEKYVERAMEQAKDLARFVEKSMKDEQSGKKLYYPADRIYPFKRMSK